MSAVFQSHLYLKTCLARIQRTYPAVLVASGLMMLLPVYWGASTPMGSNMDTPSGWTFNGTQRP